MIAVITTLRLDGQRVSAVYHSFSAALADLPQDLSAADTLRLMTAAYDAALFELQSIAAGGVATAGCMRELEKRLRHQLAIRFAPGIWD